MRTGCTSLDALNIGAGVLAIGGAVPFNDAPRFSINGPMHRAARRRKISLAERVIGFAHVLPHTGKGMLYHRIFSDDDKA